MDDNNKDINSDDINTDNEVNHDNDNNNETAPNNEKKSVNKPVRLRLGTLSTLMVIFAVAITIVVNMVVENLDLFYDLTPDRFFSISETSNEILAQLDQPVTIYTLFRTGEEARAISIHQQFLASYRAFPMVNVVNIDPIIHADFVARYARPGETIPVNSLIIESEGRHRVIHPHELRTTRFDMFTFQEIVETITFESVVTNAIRQVVWGFDYKIYFVTGHDEVPISRAFMQEFEDWHFTLENLDISMIDRIPDDASALFITTPARDWSERTALVVQEYLERGGKAVFFIEFAGVDTDFPNLRRLVNYFGIDFGDTAILESDTNFLVPLQGGQVNPFAIIPMYYGRHPITSDIIDSDFRILLLNARPLKEHHPRRQAITTVPILISSPNSYLKDLQNFDPETMTLHREPDDETGPFVLAYAITDRTSTPHSRIVFIGTEAPLLDHMNTGANFLLVLNMFSWAMDSLPNVWIEAMVVNDNNLTFNNINEMRFIINVSLFAIPGSILATGTVVWLRRRNK